MRIFFIIAISFIYLSTSLCRGQTYHLTDLGATIGTNSYAQGINNQGQVVGYWDTTNGAHAFMYAAGAVTDLGPLGAVAGDSYALSINNAGQVVGFARTTNGASAFIYQNGTNTPLGDLGGLGSYAFGINTSGQIVGFLETTNGMRAILYDAGDVINVGTLGGTNSYAYGINDSMQVVGSSLLADDTTTHALLWQGGVIFDLNQFLPKYSGWELKDAHGIDNAGDIAGWGIFAQSEHAFLFSTGGLTADLGILPGGTNSYALGLNNSNQVVGASSSTAANHAVVWNGGVVTDLNYSINASGWELKEACGINDLGQIVGWGIANGQVRAFLLTPVATNQPSAVATQKSASVVFASPDTAATLIATTQKPGVIIKELASGNSILPPGHGTLTVTVTNPVANASFNGPTNLLINAITADTAGTVTQLQFYVGTKLLGAKTNSPNSLVWTNANAGEHALKAVAMDNAGLIATSSIVNISISSNLVPVGDVYVRDGTYTNTNFGATNILECLTTSTNGNNRDVYFEFNLAGLGGVSTAQLKAYGQLSAAGTVSNTVYSVTNTSWSQTNITWNNKPGRVAALLTNGLSGTNWFTFDISSYVKTQHAAGQSLVSVALHDLTNYAVLTTFNSTGNTTNQPYLVVFATNNPLSIVITNPVNNALFAGPTNLTLNASAFDSDGVVTQVQYLQGTNLLGSSTGAPYGIVWSNVTSGAYSLTAIARDNGGIVSTSSAVGIMVELPPYITVQPTNQTVIQGSNVTFAATVTGTSPLIYQWRFNATNVISGGTNSSLTLTNVQSTNAGNYSLYVTNAVGSVTSSVAALTVLLPSISFVNPPNNAVIVASVTNVTLTAVVSNVIAGISQVQFFQGSASLGVVTNAPYTLIWSNAVTGTYSLTAVATNTYGLAITSAVVNLTISPLFGSNTMLLWLKADAITGLASNAGVATWPDQSGQGNNATQTSGTHQPLWVPGALNGLPVVQFAGSGNDYFSLPNYLLGTTGAEAVVVLKVAGNNNQLWSWGSGAYAFYPNSSGQITETFGSSSTYNLGVPAQALTQYNVYDVAATNGSWSAWLDGVLQLTEPGNTYAYNYYGAVSIGGNWNSFYGSVAELLVFNRPLTPAERQDVNVYLNGKYALVPAVPPVPTNLVATAISSNQISLTWSEPLTNGGATQIEVERSTSSNGVFAAVGQVSDALSYVDTNLAAGTAYYYQLQAVNLTQWSAPSAEAWATTLTNGVSVPLGNLVLWLKADTGTAQLVSSNLLNFWEDQSGQGNNATQTSGTHQPLWVPGALNGLPVVQFAGSGNDYFSLPNYLLGTTGAEAVVVLKVAGNNNQLWSWGSGAYAFYPNSSGQITETFGSSSTYNLGVPAQALTQYNVYDVAATNGSWSAWLDGVLQLTEPGNTYAYNYYGAVSIGGNWNSFYGSVAELLVFNRPLTPAERQDVNVYLNGKYALVPAVPPVPTNLVATAISSNQISLTWSEPLTNGGATQIEVERSTSSNGVFAAVGQVNNALSYVDTNLTAGTTYYYQVQAVNLTQWSVPSGEAWATTLTNTASLPLGNLLLWLKADSGLAQTGSNALINSWADQSGQANNATQTISYREPSWEPGALNGLPVVQFSGTPSLNLPDFLLGTTGAEAMVVLKVAASSGQFWYMGGGYAFYPYSNGQIIETFGTGSSYNLGVPAQPLTQYHLYDVASGSPQWGAWIDGTLLYATTTNIYEYFNVASLSIGTGQYGGFTGSAAEIMVFNRTLTADEKDAVGGYLMSKYNLYPFATNSVPPSAPTNFNSVGLAPFQLNLQWSSTSSNVNSFHLERELGTNSTYQEISAGGIQTYFSNFVDTTASPTNQYNYRVRAHNYFGDMYSTVISPPTISLTNWPSTILQNTQNLIQAQAGDLNGTISSVQFVANNGMYATATTAPYSAEWTPTTEGACILSALAADSLGNSQYSASVSVVSYLDSNGDGIPDAFQVQAGNNPLNPWTPPTGDNSTNPPSIILVTPANATLVP